MSHAAGRASGVAIIWLSLIACGGPPVSPPHATAPPAAASAPADAEQVGTASELELHSAFWANLHHVLYAEAWARRGVPPAKSRAGSFPAPLTAELTPEERAAWDRAVAYYDRELADKDMLFDDAMDAIRQALLAAPTPTAAAPRPPAGLAAEHAAVLAAAAPVYRAHWWPAHDRANRAWIADTLPRLQALSPAVPDRLAGLYTRPWFTTPVRVDVVFIGIRQGAYTSLEPAPAHITVASSDRQAQQWAAAEIMFHEASHALVRPIRDVFDHEATAAGKSIPGLWHVALFYLTGEVVRKALAGRGIDYAPYLYASGLFDRAWPQWRAPLEIFWRPYVDGQRSLADAVAQVVAAAPAP